MASIRKILSLRTCIEGFLSREGACDAGTEEDGELVRVEEGKEDWMSLDGTP
jgi:hypothetical protein